MTFRKAKISDIKEMQELYIDTIESICCEDYDQLQIQAWISGLDNAEPWLDLIKKQYVLLAIIEDKIVGYGTLKDGNYIDLFYIHKDFQRQSIATQILSKLEAEAKKANSKTISSDVSITAKPFFEKKGFLVKAEQRNLRKNVTLINYKMTKEI